MYNFLKSFQLSLSMRLNSFQWLAQTLLNKRQIHKSGLQLLVASIVVALTMAFKT